MFHPVGKDSCSRKTLVSLLLLLAVGAGLRLYGLDIQSLCFDETCSWHTSSHAALADVVHHDKLWHLHPPGYHLFLHFVIEMFGDSETVLRLPSALAGVASIVLMFLLGARLYSADEGLIAAGLTTALLFPVYYAQEARPYAMLLGFTILTTFLWTYLYDDLRQRRKPRFWAVATYAVCAVLTCYWHYFGVLFIVLQGAVTCALLLGKRRPFILAVLVYGIIGAAYVPWVPTMWALLHDPSLGHAPPVGGLWRSFFRYLSSMFNHGALGTPLSRGVTVVVLLLYGYLAVRGLRAILSKGVAAEDRRCVVIRGLCLTAWLTLPFLFAYAKSVSSASIFTHKNLIVSLPAVYLLAARGLAQLPLPKRDKALPALVCVLLAAAFFRTAIASGYYTKPHKDQFREAVAAVVEENRRLDNTVIVGTGYNAASYDYYLKRLGSRQRVDLLAGKTKDIGRVRLFIKQRKPDYIWCICSDPFPDNGFVDFLNRDFTVIGFQRFLRVQVFLLRPKPYQSRIDSEPTTS